MKWVLAIIFLLGCGNIKDLKALDYSWDLNVPFTLSIETDKILGLQAPLQTGIEALGGTVGYDYKQTIHVKYNESCSCSICMSDTNGFVSYNEPDVINICPFAGTDQSITSRLMLHELGHSLGFHMHLATNSFSIMAPDVSQEITDPKTKAPLMNYTSLDRAVICGAGILKGNCNN